MNVLLGVLLACLVWRAADRLFSRSAANFALALFAFSPALIAHFSIATTDGAATLFIFAAAWALVRWRRRPTWLHTLGRGLLLGLMLLAKFSTAPMFVLALLWMLLLNSEESVLRDQIRKASLNRMFRAPMKWNWRNGSGALLAWLRRLAGYFFTSRASTVRNGTLTATFPNWNEPIVKHVGGTARLQSADSGGRIC